MAIKNMATTALFFVQNASTGLGVTGLTSGNFSSIKLAQDNVLSDELQPITVSGYGGGYYGFAVTAGQMNYGCILPIVVSSGNFQPYSVAMYTEQNYLPANSGVLATNSATINTVSGKVDSTLNTVVTISGNLLRTENTLITVSGNILDVHNDLVGVSGLLQDVDNEVDLIYTTLNTVSGNLDTVTNNVATVSGLVNNLPTITTIVASGNAENWNSTTITNFTNEALTEISDNILTRTIDGVTVSGVLEKTMGMVDGSFTFDTGSKELTVFKRDDSTPLYVVSVPDDYTRERV